MDKQTERFYQENEELIQQLTESLEAILKKFDEGITPGAGEKLYTVIMLNTYLNTLEKFSNVSNDNEINEHNE